MHTPSLASIAYRHVFHIIIGITFHSMVACAENCLKGIELSKKTSAAALPRQALWTNVGLLKETWSIFTEKKRKQLQYR